jgi:predicted RND superfamily exporter protein
VPLVPIALATGWSALVLFALRVELNPMSVTLGALVVAISTEFSVLLAERYRQERGGGLRPREALLRTYASTGAAVVASGVTAIAGFAVLIVSDIQMLRDFGWVTVIDLAVSLLGVLIVLPAVLIAAERRAARRAREPQAVAGTARPDAPALRDVPSVVE